jgi:hypothetical protein
MEKFFYIPLAPFKGGMLFIGHWFVKHISHGSFLLLIYSVGKVHKRV